MKYWDDLTPEEREAYVSQDHVHRDSRLIYMNADLLSVCDARNEETWADIILDESKFEFLKKIKLTDRQRYCFNENIIYGRTQEDIGTELGIPQQTVSFHVNRARKKICKYLKNKKFVPFIRFNKKCRVTNGLFSDC